MILTGIPDQSFFPKGVWFLQQASVMVSKSNMNNTMTQLNMLIFPVQHLFAYLLLPLVSRHYSGRFTVKFTIKIIQYNKTI